MEQHELPDHVVTRLVLCGHADDPVAELHRLFTATQRQEYSYVVRRGWTPLWPNAAWDLDAADLSALIRVLTLAEEDLKAWYAGSVSSVISLWPLFVSRCSRTEADALYDWVRAHSTNFYLPTGSSCSQGWGRQVQRDPSTARTERSAETRAGRRDGTSGGGSSQAHRKGDAGPLRRGPAR